MNDGWAAAIALTVLVSGVGGCVLLHHWGLAATYVRDLLHVGTGVWVLSWPWFSSTYVPVAIVVGAALLTNFVPLLSRTSPAVRRVHDAFTSSDEHWRGLSLYTLAYAALTSLGFVRGAFPAGAGLLALSLGDGVGGLLGRRFGRRRYRVAGGKEKSIEGSVAVAVFASAGVALAAWRFDQALSLSKLLLLGVVAAGVEALSPRSSDNVTVPTAVWAFAEVTT
ncbi:MAG: hypothetical protein R3B13_34465 [Polyangiaceae bacterium]